MVQRAEHRGPWPTTGDPVKAQVDSRDAEGSPAATADDVLALVYRQMRTLTGHRDVDELSQIAAEQAIRALPSFRGASRLSTWTFRICYLTVRKHDRWYRRWLRRFTLTDDGELPERGGEGPPADQALVERERVRRIRDALAELSPKQRGVVILHDLDGCSIDEVAAVVGAKPRAVRSRLRDGRRSLARLLAGDPYFGERACRTENES